MHTHGIDTLLKYALLKYFITTFHVNTFITVELCDVAIAVSLNPASESDHSNNLTECATKRGCLPAGQTTRVQCDRPVYGQTLHISVLDDSATLILCEVFAARKYWP